MKKEKQQEIYASPEVEVMEVKAGQVICGSGSGSIENYSTEDEFNW